MKTYKEIRKDQKIVKKHHDAYSLGRYSEVDNTYPILSEKYAAFNFGRLAKLAKGTSR